MPVEEPGIRTAAHGMEPQQQIPQHFPRVEAVCGLVMVVAFLNGIVEVREDGVILWSHRREVCAVGDVPLLIELFYHQLQRVDVRRVEAFIHTEHIPQEGDVLGEQRPPESVRRVRVFRLAAIVPAAGLQQVDAVLPTEVVQKAAAQGAALVLHLMLGVQRDHAFACLPHIAEQELQKITFALPSVAEDEGAGVGLVRSTAVEVHDDVGAKPVTPDEKAFGIGFAGIVHGVQIGNAACGQYPLRKVCQLAAARGVGGEKALPLPQEQRIGAHAGADQLCGYGIPRRAQLFRIRGGNIQVNAAVDERLLFLPLLCQQLRHIPQVGLRRDALLIVVGVAPLHAAFVCGGVEDGVLLGWGDLPRRQAQIDAAHIAKAPQQRQLIRHGRVAFQCHRRMIAAAEDEVICVELHRRGRDHIQKILRALYLLCRFLFLFLFLFSHVHTPLHRNHGRPPW